MTSTPPASNVERYPHQYASTYEMTLRLQARGLIVKPTGAPGDNVSAVRYGDGAPVTVECRPDPHNGDQLWWYVDDRPVDPVGSPDASTRIAAAVKGT